MWKYTHTDEMFHGGKGSGRWKKGSTGNTPWSRKQLTDKYVKDGTSGVMIDKNRGQYKPSTGKPEDVIGRSVGKPEDAAARSIGKPEDVIALNPNKNVSKGQNSAQTISGKPEDVIGRSIGKPEDIIGRSVGKTTKSPSEQEVDIGKNKHHNDRTKDEVVPPTNNKQNSNNSNKQKQAETNEQAEQLRGASKIIGDSGRLLNTAGDAVIKIPVKRDRIDLSSMSDKELNDRINRELRERQYNDLFSQPSRAEKGRDVVAGVLTTIGSVASVAATALGIALTIQQLRKK